MRTRTKKLLTILLAALIIISAMSACKKDPPVVTPDPVTVTVKFDKQGGEGTAADKTATVGEAYGTLPSLTKAGNDFGGWFYDAAGTGAAVTAATIVVKEENHTLYAKWTAKAVTVTLDAGAGGTVSPASLTVTYGGAYGGLPTASRDGYTFGGWFVGAGGTGSEVTETTSVTNASAHTLYAKWTAISGIAVTFDLVDESAGWLGGSEAAFTGKTVTFGSAYGALPDKNDIELEDNFFGGWYLNLSEGAYSGAVYSSALVANAAAHTLYAKWIDKTEGFEIKFDLNYTSAPSIDSKYVEEHAEYGQLPEPIRTGYNFAGWFTEDGQDGWGSAVTAATIAGAGQDFTTIYADWTAKQSSLTFTANDTTGSTEADGIHTGEIKVTFGQSMPELSGIPTRTGYTFAGYYDAATSGTQYYTAALASAKNWDKDETSVMLYARWTAKSYSISYGANRPSGASGNTTTMGATSVSFDATVTLSTNSYTITNPASAYTFDGWTISAGTTVPAGSFTMVESFIPDSGTTVALLAVWKANTYTLTFNANKGTGTTDPVNIPAVTVTLTYGQPIPDALNGLAQTSRYGYTFNGFFTTASSTVKVYNADMTPNGNLAWTTSGNIASGGTALYAQWTAMRGTVRFDTNGASAITTNYTNRDFAAAINSSGSLPTNPTRTGYTFLAWVLSDPNNPGKVQKITARTDIIAIEPNPAVSGGTNGSYVLVAQWAANNKTSWDFSKVEDVLSMGYLNNTMDNGQFWAGDLDKMSGAVSWDYAAQAIKVVNTEDAKEIWFQLDHSIPRGTVATFEVSVVLPVAMTSTLRLRLDMRPNAGGQTWITERDVSPVGGAWPAANGGKQTLTGTAKVDSKGFFFMVVDSGRNINMTGAIVYLHSISFKTYWGFETADDAAYINYVGGDAYTDGSSPSGDPGWREPGTAPITYQPTRQAIRVVNTLGSSEVWFEFILPIKAGTKVTYEIGVEEFTMTGTMQLRIDKRMPSNVWSAARDVSPESNAWPAANGGRQSMTYTTDVDCEGFFFIINNNGGNNVVGARYFLYSITLER